MTDSSLTFTPVGLEDYDRIYRYTSVYGEGSCQHSPVSMYSLSEKYGDSVCEQDGFLYTLRSGLCDETYRVYLAPFGSGDLKTAYQRILDDAAAHGKKAKFFTLTESAADFLSGAFPDRFDVEENRDLAEYFCRTQSTATFAGGQLQRRRREVHTFWHLYGDRASIHPIVREDMDDILAFKERWLSMSETDHDMSALGIESRMIDRQLAHFDELKLTGIVLRIDGWVEGISYGTRLSDKYFDGLVEKGNRNIPHIAKVLRMESAKQCAGDCEYFNMEEDVGVPGLRAVKMSYCPEYLLRKFIASER